MARINSLLASNDKIQIILIPSLKDANHQYVYPQPPFGKKTTYEALESPNFRDVNHIYPNCDTFTLIYAHCM